MEKIKEFGRKLMYGRNTYSPKVKKILKDFGDEEITNLYIIRTPISKVLRFLMNILSLGEFEKRMKNTPYDDLYHLAIHIETSKGKVSLEKNEVINMDRNPKKPKNAEILNVTIGKKLTINEMLDKTKTKMGKNFFPYSAKDNNCQRFILSLLQANNLANKANKDFVKQDTNELFSSHLRKATNTVTDVAGRLNILASGGTVKKISQPIQMTKSMKEKKAKELANVILGSGIFDDIGNWFKEAGKDIKKTFSKKKGNELARSALPALGGILGTVAGPLGTVAGITAGDQVGRALTGKGVKGARKGRFVKGSQEAKDYMASIRKKKGKNENKEDTL
tara:strand:- start:1360 stop:2364 length:1005 start_codon:yes stop_codon:yes gene_type:complete